MNRRPTPEEFHEFVRKYDKRIGLRKIYRDFHISKSERHKYRELWNRFYEIMPDAFEKDVIDDTVSIGSIDNKDRDLREVGPSNDNDDTVCVEESVA